MKGLQVLLLNLKYNNLGDGKTFHDSSELQLIFALMLMLLCRKS